MLNDTDNLRHDFVAQNTAAVQSNIPENERLRLETIHGNGNVWNTTELQNVFEVRSFMAPFCIVTRKADNQKGCVEFQDYPRFYFRFTPKA